MRARRTLPESATIRETAPIVNKKVLIIVENLPVPFDAPRVEGSQLASRARLRSYCFVSAGQGLRATAMKFSMAFISTAIPCRTRETVPSAICGSTAALCSGSSSIRGGSICAADFMSFRAAIRPTIFSWWPAVQAVRREIHLRSSRCEPGAVSFEIRKEEMFSIKYRCGWKS